MALRSFPTHQKHNLFIRFQALVTEVAETKETEKPKELPIGEDDIPSSNGNGNGAVLESTNGNGTVAYSSNDTDLSAVGAAEPTESAAKAESQPAVSEEAILGAAVAAAAVAVPAAAAAAAEASAVPASSTTSVAPASPVTATSSVASMEEELAPALAGQLEMAAATSEPAKADAKKEQKLTAAGTPYANPGGRWSQFKSYSTFQRTCQIWGFAIQFAFKYFLINQKWTYGKEGMTPAAVSSKKSELAVWLREGLVKLGPTFIKIGQQFSTRVDVLSKVSAFADSAAPRR